MKRLIVLSGEYYCGENKQDNKLMFIPDRAEAVAVDEIRLITIIDIILGWFTSGTIKLKRIEVLKVGQR